VSSVLPRAPGHRPAVASAVLPPPPADPRQRTVWWIALAGFAAMYMPVYWWAANLVWQSDDHAHGALILLVLIWLFWGMRAPIAAAPTRPARALGWSLFAVGIVLYVVGRAVEISIFIFGSQPFIVAAILLLLKGPAAIRVAWFALFYFIFMIPLPGIFVDGVTQPLKQWISAIVVELLYHVGYPISRNGVVLTIGQYQMLVADACSGLHSMYSLSALGTLFMYIMARPSRLHNAVMLASILPIAFVANIVRVIALVLITYHFGDEAGQGFLHGAAGIVLMLVALLLFFALDASLDRLSATRAAQGGRPLSDENRKP
jgi:exosortase B